MADDPTYPVFDLGARRLAADLLTKALDTTRVRLSDAQPPQGPGVYLHFLRLPSPADVEQSYCDSLEIARQALGPVLARGSFPVYAGVASSLRDRQRRYVSQLRGMVSPDDVWVTLMPTDSHATAVWAERILHQLPLLFNRAVRGWGNRPPGAGRIAAQRTPQVDALLPGRPWAAGTRPIDPGPVIAAVQAFRESSPPRALWPGLPTGADELAVTA